MHEIITKEEDKGEKILNPAFDNLDEEKKKRIINACLEEFAENGYDKASTNTIVSKAGISKGLLFHYFGNKKNLYLYLLDMTIKHFIERFYEEDTQPSKDIFEKFIQSGMIKLKIAFEEPLLFKFIMGAFVDTPKCMEDEISARYQKIYAQTMPGFFENIDFSKFRDDIDKKKAVEFINLCLDSLYRKYVNMAKGRASKLSMEETEAMIREQYEFVDMMKNGIYKKS